MSLLNTGYQEPPERKQFELLPEGDYRFKVMDCKGIEVEENGNEKISLVLWVKDRDQYVFLYEGNGRNGPFDMISPFLKAIGERPTAAQVADSRYWSGLKGKTGQVRIKIKIQKGGKYDGKQVNDVAWWIYPDAGPQTHRTPAQATGKRLGATAPHDTDLDSLEPDNIPFRTTIYKDVRKNRLNRPVI